RFGLFANRASFAPERDPTCTGHCVKTAVVSPAKITCVKMLVAPAAASPSTTRLPLSEESLWFSQASLDQSFARGSAYASSPLPIFAICSRASAPTLNHRLDELLPDKWLIAQRNPQALTKRRRGASGVSFWRQA